MRLGPVYLLLVGLVACGPSGSYADFLVGEWQWVETSGGPTSETRANPEHRWRLRFHRDGTVREEYAGRPPATGTYDVEARDRAEEQSSEPVLGLGGGSLVMTQDAPFGVVLLADTLLLSSVVADGFSYRFVRVGGR